MKVASRAGEGAIGHLSIAAPAGINHFLVQPLRVFRQRYPGVRVELQFMSTGQQMEALWEGRIQAGFLILPPNDPSITLETVQKAPIWVALPKRHPLTRQKYVRLAELAEHEFILFARRSSPGLHDVITSMCRNAGFSLKVVHEVNNIIAAFTLVAAGLGLCFSAPTMQTLWPDVVFRPIRDAIPQMEYSVAYHKDAYSPPLDAFLRVVRETSGRKG